MGCTAFCLDSHAIHATEPRSSQPSTELSADNGAGKSRTAPASPTDQKGTVAVLRDDIPAVGAPASPEFLAGALRSEGFGTVFLDSKQLADPKALNRASCDVLVLPYGASFPVAAASNFREFLRKGGKFLSMGGYAFDNLLELGPQGWAPPNPPPAPATDLVMWHCSIPAEELRNKGPLTYSGWLKTAAVSGPGMAFFAVYQIAADGSLPEWRDTCRVSGSQDWKEYPYRFKVHPQAVRVDLRAGLFRCRGKAWFDDLRLTDETGHVLVNSGFEEPFDPDKPGDRQWARSDPQLCAVQASTRHSGARALQATLSFAPPREERLNTRRGLPADGLEVEPTQLGVFQPDYLLERVGFAHAAPNQVILDAKLRLEGPLTGYAACGVVGFDQARWQSLLNAYDRFGRLRGSAGALSRHYSGPYAGSSWAFFGVTNRNLFSAAEPSMTQALGNLVQALTEDIYLPSLVTERARYRPGDDVEIHAVIFNGGRQEKRLQLKVEIYEGEPNDQGQAPGAPLAVLTQTAVAAPGGGHPVRLHWKLPPLKSDFGTLVGRLFEDERELDRIDGGFVIASERTVAAGPQLNYRDNYLRFGKRPLFLFGTDDWGYVFNTTRETPLQWLRDMRQRRDLGVMLYENLQFGLPKSPDEQEKLLDKVDGLAQLAQKFQQVYFPCLLCGYNVAVSDAELHRHREYCEAFARRYAHVPGLVYYLNGDLRCELSDNVTPQWTQFLQQRFATPEQVGRRWGADEAFDSWGKIRAEDFNDWEHAWGDLKVYDQNRFRAELLRRWSSELIRGIRQHDQAHPITAEFYQVPHQGVDIPAGIGDLDLSNFGYFERPWADLARFAPISKLNDQRARGKSFGPGEYGVKTHPAWGDGQDYGYHARRSREEAIDLYLAVAHYTLGLGGSRIQNWCWKDDADRVFPWGMVYPCDNVPKEIGYVHRNQSFLFRQFAPVYQTPSAYVLTADGHRFGGGKWQVIEGILTAFDLALSTQIENLGTLNEIGLRIPEAAKLIYYPLPFCPSDDIYQKLLPWVRAGGVLYVSGDISYTETRQRGRTQRLAELCGVRFQAEQYPNISVNATNAADQPCIVVEPITARVLKRTRDGLPLIVENQVGRGTVIYTTDPIEFHSVPGRRADDIALYASVLARAKVARIIAVPQLASLRAFKVPLQDGGSVCVLINSVTNRTAQTITLTELKPPLTLTVTGPRPALAWWDGQGRLRAVETQGPCAVGEVQVVKDGTDGIVLSLDGQDLQQSRALLLMPTKPGTVEVRSTVNWRQPVVQTGDFQNGLWRVLESRALPPQAERTTVEVSADQVFSLLLICEQSEASRWHSAVEQALCDPASLP